MIVYHNHNHNQARQEQRTGCLLPDCGLREQNDERMQKKISEIGTFLVRTNRLSKGVTIFSTALGHSQITFFKRIPHPLPPSILNPLAQAVIL
jgi:hypothetical protein